MTLIMNMGDDKCDEIENGEVGEAGIPWVLDAYERHRVRS
jgi:hypothetical protein